MRYLALLCLVLGACAPAPKIIQYPLETIGQPEKVRPQTTTRPRSITLRCDDCEFGTAVSRITENRATKTYDDWMDVGDSLYKLYEQHGIIIKQRPFPFVQNQ